jgi:hypothetical protein
MAAAAPLAGAACARRAARVPARPTVPGVSAPTVPFRPVERQPNLPCGPAVPYPQLLQAREALATVPASAASLRREISVHPFG